MEILRTPDERFAALPGYAYAPRYAQIGELRMHYLDEGPRDGAIVLCLPGDPSGTSPSRKMTPPLVAAGLRVVAPDLIGFGRSDKPASRDDYTFQRHVDWMAAFLDAVSLRDLT